ncbi:hypothetical protein ANO11243_003930 [Dothideomycetidae sp. 11243]|nr:hypothetical protein ANO11243_003930 [fungal sp. No.11243]
MPTSNGVQQQPRNWPDGISFISDQAYSPAVDATLLQKLHTPTASTASWPKISSKDGLSSPCKRVTITSIAADATSHPARGQHGLFAATHLPPDSFIVLYVGLVHTGAEADTNAASDYDLSLDRDLGLAVDAADLGNEARFVNDYRGIADAPNAEFRDCWVQMLPPSETPSSSSSSSSRRWERRMGVFVLGKGKAGKRVRGISPGQEILVNYGRTFWRERNKAEEEGDA